MSNPALWEQRYSEAGYAYGVEPNAFLVDQAWRLHPGMSALAVGDGEGRNGVWLAQQGLNVLAVDQSCTGLQKAEALARSRGVSIRTECADLGQWSWPEGDQDVVVSIFVHFAPQLRPRMHRAMLQALKPGGLLIMEAFHVDQLCYRSGGPPVGEMLYTAEMLREDFAGGNILELTQTAAELDEGRYHHGTAAVLRLILQRPSS